MEMTKKFYLETLKSALGHSIYHYLYARYNLYQFILLYAKCLCCLDIFAALLPRTSLSNEYASLFSRGGTSKNEKMYVKKLKYSNNKCCIFHCF